MLSDAWDWAGAERAFRKALALNPDSQTTCDCYANLLVALGRPAEAITLLRHSVQVNPLAAATYANFGGRLLDSRQYAEAETVLRRAIDMEPSNFLAHTYLSGTYLATGRAAEAVRLLKQSPLRETSTMARVYAAAGHTHQARALLRKILPRATPTDYLSVALTYAYLNDRTPAFEWLSKAFDVHYPAVPFARVSPLFDVFRGDPRFDALVARLHLP